MPPEKKSQLMDFVRRVLAGVAIALILAIPAFIGSYYGQNEKMRFIELQHAELNGRLDTFVQQQNHQDAQITKHEIDIRLLQDHDSRVWSLLDARASTPNGSRR